ncbi:MFS transporter [Phosphitispora sp. TUW77]|uniref:MFS transporter n=1 Tax=Phosphitispora sp. TUW77 TaxID=3152361 RepID=UPI003AB28E75
MHNSDIQGPVKMSPRSRLLLIIGLYFFISAAQLFALQVSTAIVKIVDTIGGIEYLSVAFTAIMMGAAVMSPIAGKLSDLFGRRRVLFIGVLVLFLSELLGIFVQNIFQFIAIAGIQGIGGGFAITVSLIVIADVCSTEERAKYIGYYGSLMAGLVIFGPLLGGVIVDNFNWNWIFVTLMPFSLIGGILIFKFMPDIPRSENTKIDYLGSFLITAAIVLTVLITVVGGKQYPWGSPTILIMCALAVISFVSFILVEKRSTNPIMSMSIFSNFTFTLCFIACFLIIMAGVAISYYFPVYVQKVRGMTPTDSGMFLACRGVLAFFVSAFNGWVISRIKEYRWNALVTVLLMCAALFSFYMMDAQTSVFMIILTIVFVGLAGAYNNIFHIGAQMSLPNNLIVPAMGAMQLAVAFGATLGNVLYGLFLRTPDIGVGIKNLFLCSFVISLVVVVCIIALLLDRGKAQKSAVSHISK